MRFHGEQSFYDPLDNLDPGLKLTIKEPTINQDQSTTHRDQPVQETEKPKLSTLSQDELHQLFSRVKAIEKEDEQKFALRKESVPAPKTGDTITQKFPPDDDLKPPQVDSAQPELRVLRYLPEGAVNLAPNLSVTFSLPMVAVSDISSTDKFVPIEIEPKVEGRFRWVDTKTLQYEPTHRFRQATKYKVRIPKGTKSIFKAELKEDFVFEFQTPPPLLEQMLPRSNSPAKPLFFFQFNQLIDPVKVLDTIKIVGESDAKFKLLSVEEAKQRYEQEKKCFKTNPYVYENAFNSTKQGQFMWFETEKPLKLGTRYTVEIGPGTPSAEGPLVTTSKLTYSFSTYDIMKFTRRYPEEIASPNHNWTLYFTNPIETSEFKPDDIVSIKPESKKLKIEAVGHYLLISGAKSNTKYTVTVNTNLKDVYGQNLDKEVTLTFKVGTLPQKLTSPNSYGVIVLDPMDKKEPSFEVNVRNLDKIKVSLFQVTPEDYPSCPLVTGKDFPADKKPFSEEIIETKGKTDVTHQVSISISKALKYPKERLGHVFVQVEPEKNSWKGEYKYRPIMRSWIQVTNLAIDAFINQNTVFAWANDLRDGSVLSKVKFSYQSVNGETDDTGLAVLTLPKTRRPGMHYTHRLVATHNNDTAFLLNVYQMNEIESTFISKIFTDRMLYKPNEEVNVKGFIRNLNRDGVGYTVQLPENLKTIAYSVTDPRGKEFHKGETNLTKHGSFSIKFKLPDNINLGHCNITFTGTKYREYHSFKCQEFRTPEFEVKTSVESVTHLANSTALLTANASYYSGGGLDNATVYWTISQARTTYSPPGWAGFSFQKKVPRYWWWIKPENTKIGRKRHFNGKTDATGEHKLSINIQDNNDRPRKTPVTITAQASVQDINRQTINGSTSFLVHPSSLYIGVRDKKSFVKAGESIPLDFIVTNINGLPIKDVPVQVQVLKEVHKLESNTWITENKQVKEITIKSSDKPVPLDLELKEGGYYFIKARIKDKNGLENETETTICVQGEPNHRPSITGAFVSKDRLVMIPDKESYQPGDEAQILIQAPFEPPCQALLMVLKDGVISKSVFQMKESSYIAKIPITKDSIPNIKVYVYIVGTSIRENERGRDDKDAPKRPAYASEVLDLEVPPLQHQLNVTAVPEKQNVTPGSNLKVKIEVTDHQKKPLPNSEVTLIVVDEAILSLAGYNLSNPISTFFPKHRGVLNDISLRSTVLLKTQTKRADMDDSEESEEDDLDRGEELKGMRAKKAMGAEMMFMKSASAFSNSSEPTEIQLRSNFSPLAAFFANLETDKDGKIEANVKMPDNLTRYRVWAVAVHGASQFGLGENFVVTALPLMIRPSLPRFLNYGDQCEFAVVIQSQSSKELSLNVGARMENLVMDSSVGQSSYKLTLGPNKRLELRFPVKTQNPGKAHFQVAMEVPNESFSDAVEMTIPVWTPATTEAFATYGNIDKENLVVQQIRAPKDIFKEFGGVQISTCSTALQSLTDAFLHLVHYPFDCCEQVASKLLSIIALEDVLTAFNVKSLPKKDDLKGHIKNSINKLARSQRYDGSFGFWDSQSRPDPFVSCHCAHALARAKEKGYAVPETTILKSNQFLSSIDRLISTTFYSEKARNTLKALSLYVMTLMKDAKYTVVQQAQKLYKDCAPHFKDIGLEGLGWLALTIFKYQNKTKEVEDILKYIKNRVNETAETANFISSYGTEEAKLVMLHSDRKTDAVMLETLLTIEPDNSLIPKVVKGLLAHKKKGHWGSTQENVFVLLSLDKYFRTYEKETPDFVLKMWLGDSFVGEQVFKGRSTNTNLVEIPMTYVVNKDVANYIMQKVGNGRLYYRIGMNYAPTNLRLPPASYGFIVERKYVPVSNNEHVKRDQDGTWRIKAGELVQVHLTIINTSRRYHVAVVDKLPAGLEALNPAIPQSGSIDITTMETQSKRNKYWWFNRTWYEHQNIRDERVEAFTSLLWEGTHEYKYVARATSFGKFVVPPAKAEEMYAPEIFGRSGVDIVIVE